MIKKRESTPVETILKALPKLRHAISSKELLKKSGIKDKPVFYNTLHQIQVHGDVYVSKRHQAFGKADQIRMVAMAYFLSEGLASMRPENDGDDLYVSGDRLKGATVGDMVLLESITEIPRGKKVEVAPITKRRQWMTTGTVCKSCGSFEIVPNIAIRYSLPIPKGSLMGVQPGGKVQAELVRVPRREKLSTCAIKIYGTAESAKICTGVITDQNDIPMIPFKVAMAEAARAVQEPITQEELTAWLDPYEEMICAVDGADAKDLDDAISARRTEHDLDLGAHTADVSHYVHEDSAVDEEAFLRSTSVYFTDRVIPMLPKKLSSGACLLNTGEDKLTFSALICLDDKSEIVSHRFQETVIHFKVRGMHSEVDRIFSDETDETLLEKYASMLESLKTGRELAKILGQCSRGKGAVDFENGGSMSTLDESGVCIDVRPRMRGEAEKMIEQLMITANRVTAKLAKEKQLPFVYHIHGNPDPEHTRVFIGLTVALGFSIQCPRSEKPSPADFPELLGQVRGTPAGQVIPHQVLRTMEKVKYPTESVDHFGLAFADYCHLTLPIQRYPDLATHHILSQPWSLGQIELTLRFASSTATTVPEPSKSEVCVATAERSAEDCYKAGFTKSHIGEEFDGVASGVIQRGVFAQLQNSVEGFAPIGAFSNADYRFDDVIMQVDKCTGSRITTSIPMKILMTAVGIPVRRMDFLPVEQEINSRETV